MVMNVGRHCRDVHKISYNVLSDEGKKKCPLCDKYVKHLVKHLKGAKHDKDDTQVKELVMSLDKRRRDNTAKVIACLDMYVAIFKEKKCFTNMLRF